MVGKMKLRTFIAVLFAGTAIGCQAAIVKGTVKSGDRPLSEVIVTDGFSFTVTDTKGGYSLDTSAKAEFIYLLTPKGYVADFSSGTPQFYQPLEAGKASYAFNLRAMKGNPDEFAMITLADPQLDTDRDVERLFGETLPDIRKTAASYPDAQIAGIILGDLTWDVYKYNSSIKEFARQTGMPVYPVIGNHDFDKYINPAEHVDFAHIYKKEFGPLYYAFQLGDAYYIVLNDIEFYGHKRYKVTLEMEDQMNWLKGLLNCVLQQDKKVFIAMHAPLKPFAEAPLIPGGDLLKKMLVNKFQATILSGHFHQNTHTDIGAGITEHNLGAVCGTWWSGNYCSDGTPSGYQVFEGKGNKISSYYKATGKENTYQLKVYPKGRVADRPEAIVAKVWNWKSDWRIRWYEDDRLMGDMSQFYSFDPDYLQHLNGRRAVEDYAPSRTNHYFSATPGANTKLIKIEVTDSHGKVYSETISNS